jgi:apolipoprotein N-acyltransferase
MASWVGIATVAFHLAYVWPLSGFFVVVYLFALAQLARLDTWRKAFYSGLAVGLLIAVGRLDFFWTIFSAGALALWLVYAFWLGLFVALARLGLRRFGQPLGWVLIPFFWCGLEYFRSELYYLRFGWLTPGFAFGEMPIVMPFKTIGTYGISFLLMGLGCSAASLWTASKLKAISVLALGLVLFCLWGALEKPDQHAPRAASVRVTGVQMEFPTEKEVLIRLDETIRRHPETELIVLSEYTFTGPVPEKVKDWCRAQQRYVIIGAEKPVTGGNFYDTAFVLSPQGEVIFQQAKSVPIQFFKDGLPALSQTLWDSPWGRIGICICYDLSYRRVTDRLIGLGAQALIVPTMDVADWGKPQHELHARVAPTRAAEYGIPVFRVASSGISQLVNNRGEIIAGASFPGQGEMLAGTLELRGTGKVPWDHWLAPCATGLSGLFMLQCLLRARRQLVSHA